MRDYKTQIGGTVTIDESVEACQKFGFKPGDRIIGPCGINATVLALDISQEVNKMRFGTPAMITNAVFPTGVLITT